MGVKGRRSMGGGGGGSGSQGRQRPTLPPAVPGETSASCRRRAGGGRGRDVPSKTFPWPVHLCDFLFDPARSGPRAETWWVFTI